MLDVLLVTCLAAVAPQGPRAGLAEAVAVRGEPELSPAAALSSARQKAAEHVLEQWRHRADLALGVERPFWLPEVLAEPQVRRWLADLPLERMVVQVDREDRERVHEFGNSYQTTLWVAEDPRVVDQHGRLLRSQLRRLERTVAVRYGGVVGAWVLLGLGIGWLDRLSRGYMTGRLRLLGLLAGVAIPAVAFTL
ncbi:MAG: hypothetical protein JNK78_00900 [Planctomycetes bacterium]|nr:hypothetical protein [Planctomycetota bacterium]